MPRRSSGGSLPPPAGRPQEDLLAPAPAPDASGAPAPAPDPAPSPEVTVGEGAALALAPPKNCTGLWSICLAACEANWKVRPDPDAYTVCLYNCEWWAKKKEKGEEGGKEEWEEKKKAFPSFHWCNSASPPPAPPYPAFCRLLRRNLEGLPRGIRLPVLRLPTLSLQGLLVPMIQRAAEANGKPAERYTPPPTRPERHLAGNPLAPPSPLTAPIVLYPVSSPFVCAFLPPQFKALS